ncbi:MAG: GGDEF domain-containing protein [Polyangiaceae bacterium]|nr:GGDEF domain-containing protein [Polyangiaceae bacterium]
MSGAGDRGGERGGAPDDLVFRVGLARLVFGAAAVVAVPLAYPTTSRVSWVYGAYLVLALVEQLLISRRVGSTHRSLVFGVIDGAMVTALVHQLGSSGSVVPALYLFAGVMNALVITPRVGLALVSVYAAMYVGIVAAEQARVVAYAPDVPWLSALGPPSWRAAAISASLIVFLLFASTYIVARLHRVLRAREAALLEANLRLEALSVRDPLTGLFNRRRLLEEVERQLARARRGASVAVIMVDLDRFKRVNDERGHLEGDRLLCEVAAALSSSVRSTDVAARYGGDEFVVVLPDTSVEQASTVAARIVAQVRAVGELHDAARPVTASVGLALAGPGDDARRLVQRADSAAYAAKRGGGDHLALAA